MKIEFLYPNMANLFGEIGDMEYIQRLFPEAECIHTQIQNVPRFIEEDVGLVFMAPMSEQVQEYAIEALMPHKERIKQRIEDGVHFMFIGNAMELFGEWIETDEGKRIPGLGIFPLTAKRQMLKRLNSVFLGAKDGMKIVGSKAQFTQQYLAEDFPAFCDVEIGLGLHEGAKREGIHYKNFIGTSILGPFLIMNPVFVKQWAAEIAGRPVAIPFEEISMKAFEKRCEEVRDPKATT